jgi:para-nitrobenzyl esterase
MMNTALMRRLRWVALCATLIALALGAVRARAADPGAAAATVGSSNAPVVRIDTGAIRGVAVPGVDEFLGLPYAAPPIGRLRWRPPQPPAAWHGVRDASEFAPSCPQSVVAFPPGAISEDCLYLNVYAPSSSRGDNRPVLVWIHGGGLTTDAARDYDGSELAADGIVVVTINYRLGALGFLEHPALAARPGGSTGNYGLMDQQAALRWVQRNIGRFGGNRDNVTIAGQSAGGLSVLAQLVSPGARGLFQRAIVQSGAFALRQEPLSAAEAAGVSFATAAGCPDQTAACLRNLPVSTILKYQPPFGIPGAVDGKVLTEPIGAALAAGRFAHVPILNGINHDEERIFIAGPGTAVSGGRFVLVPDPTASTPSSYLADIESVLGVSADRAAAIAAEYPTASYASPQTALSTLLSDANFACPALQVDHWTAQRVPTFAYQFNDDNAPQRFGSPSKIGAVATHGSELQYLFGLPNAPVPGTLDPSQQLLAASMRAAWANFAAVGDPSTPRLPWPSFTTGGTVMSLVPPHPQTENDSLAVHHCAFWMSGAQLGVTR